MIRKTEAIVLRSYDHRETSKIAVFFTKEYGKITGVLKGIRKDYKKFGSNVDKFSVNDIVYYWHANASVHLVSQCDLTDFFFPIRKEIKRTMAANYLIELVHKLMPPEEENRRVYQLILDYLTSLQTVSDISKLVHVFQVKILQLSGFRPHLDWCLGCQKTISGEVKFSLRLGGLLCSRCRLSDPSAVPISRGAVASILHIEKNDWEKSLRLGLTAPIKKELKYILNNFLVYHLERPLHSARYLEVG